MSKPADKSQWVRIAEQFEQSGLTQKQFAQQQGLSLSTVQSWIYRRRRQASRTEVPPVRLLPVEVSSAPMADRGGVEVIIARGTGTWASTGSMAPARYAHTATMLSNGKVLVACGNFLASAEVYTP